MRPLRYVRLPAIHNARLLEIPIFPQYPSACRHRRGAESVLTSDRLSGHLPAETVRTSTSFTIFEGTSEIQLMITERAVTGLDVR
jgi:hypothetical protein